MRSTSVATGQMRACIAKQPTDELELGCAVALLVRDAANEEYSVLPADVPCAEYLDSDEPVDYGAGPPPRLTVPQMTARREGDGVR